MSAPGPAFELRRTVGPGDLDAQAHVNNVVYVRWVQDAATAHWEALTSAATRAEVGWVLLRHEIDYRRAAVLGDAVVVRTAVGHLSGLTFERRTTVRLAGEGSECEGPEGERSEGGAVLAESRTLWCPVDPRTMRPRRVSAELRALFSVPAE